MADPLDASVLAAALVGTKSLPAGFDAVQRAATEAHAYHRLEPYPEWHFKDWKSETRGPLPRCLPLARAVVNRGATWLFGKELSFTVAANKTLEDAIKATWEANRMPVRMLARARIGGIEGGIVLKWGYDKANQERPITISTLSALSETRLYWHPHDRALLLMARVQYPYFDAVQNKTFWYREDWTDALEVHYAPVAADELGKSTPDAYEGWEITSSDLNPFGRIPLHYIQNLPTDDVWGMGDLWELYRVFDRINLTYHLMDRSNQFDSQINPIFIDADLDEEDLNTPLQPGQPLQIESQESEANKKADVKFPPSGNALRPAMMDYAKQLKREILHAAQSTEVDPSEFSNKGNLTNAVLAQLYKPQIEATEAKRLTYGCYGVEAFLASMARGLQNAGVALGVTEGNEESYDVEMKWPPYFELTEDEKAAKTVRLQEQDVAGYVASETVIREVAAMEGRDLSEVLAELAKEPAPAMDPVTGQPMAPAAAGSASATVADDKTQTALATTLARARATAGKDGI